MAALLHASAVAFTVLKWRGRGLPALPGLVDAGGTRDALSVDGGGARASAARTITSAVLVNLLNPKLTMFFFAFLPQFVDPPATPHEVIRMLELCGGLHGDDVRRLRGVRRVRGGHARHRSSSGRAPSWLAAARSSPYRSWPSARGCLHPALAAHAPDQRRRPGGLEEQADEVEPRFRADDAALVSGLPVLDRGSARSIQPKSGLKPVHQTTVVGSSRGAVVEHGLAVAYPGHAGHQLDDAGADEILAPDPGERESPVGELAANLATDRGPQRQHVRDARTRTPA